MNANGRGSEVEIQIHNVVCSCLLHPPRIQHPPPGAHSSANAHSLGLHFVDPPKPIQGTFARRYPITILGRADRGDERKRTCNATSSPTAVSAHTVGLQASDDIGSEVTFGHRPVRMILLRQLASAKRHPRSVVQRAFPGTHRSVRNTRHSILISQMEWNLSSDTRRCAG